VDSRRSGFRLNPDKFILLSIVWFYIFNFVFIGRFPLNTIPLVVGIPSYLVFIFFEGLGIEKRFLFSWVSLTFLSVIALFYLVLEKCALAFLSMEFLFFFSLPLLYLSTARLLCHGHLRLAANAFLVFLFWQLFVVVGQISMRLWGIGLHLPSYYSDDLSDNYASMLSGTFLNANDLAAVSGMFLVFFLLVREYLPKSAKIGISLCLILAVFTVSRSVLFFMICSLAVFLLRKSFLTGIALILLIGGSLILGLYFLQEYFSHLSFISRIIDRFESLWLILNYGFSIDNSISVRLFSYIHFLSNLDNLGFGSMHLRDYGMFVNSLGMKYELLAVNPHSFIVEIGYWLGFPGLLLFLIFMMAIKPKSFFGFYYVLASFLLLSMVSSSVVNNFIFFLAFFSALVLASSGITDRKSGMFVGQASDKALE
jgi:hypothetical protein